MLRRLLSLCSSPSPSSSSSLSSPASFKEPWRSTLEYSWSRSAQYMHKPADGGGFTHSVGPFLIQRESLSSPGHLVQLFLLLEHGTHLAEVVPVLYVVVPFLFFDGHAAALSLGRARGESGRGCPTRLALLGTSMTAPRDGTK